LVEVGENPNDAVKESFLLLQVHVESPAKTA
jgi:hypothetical protein